MKTRSDDELLLAFQRGDRPAFEELYHRYKDRLYGFCYRLTQDESSALDAVQDTFLKLLDHPEDIRIPAAVRSWLFTVSRNHALTSRRHVSRQDAFDEEEVWDSETPLESTVRNESVDIVQKTLKMMNSHYREILILREIEQLSYDEISTITGSSLSSVKSSLFKARKALTMKLKLYIDERTSR